MATPEAGGNVFGGLAGWGEAVVAVAAAGGVCAPCPKGHTVEPGLRVIPAATEKRKKEIKGVAT